MTRALLLITLLLTLAAAPATHGLAAGDVYQDPALFVSESYDGDPPDPSSLTVTGSLRDKIAAIMGSHYRLPSVSYWQKAGKTVWILEDIGKYEPITAGFSVGADGRMERIKVLIYRESHGWEVKHGFFTRQFRGAGLKKGKRLDKRIDGISGATLSVNTLERLSALALLLHREASSSYGF